MRHGVRDQIAHHPLYEWAVQFGDYWFDSDSRGERRPQNPLR
jgi:hypothetical protein